MNSSIRRHNCGIRVDENGKWIFNENEIINPNVLLYFRQRIQEDSLGVYIYNDHNMLVEHGYISIDGFPLAVTSASMNDSDIFLLTDAEESISIFSVFFYQFKGKIFCKKNPHSKINLLIHRKALYILEKFLEEREGSYFFNCWGKEIPIVEIETGIHVSAPENMQLGGI